MLNNISNPLAEYGQAPTPPAGSQITKIIIRDEDHQGFFDRMKERYVWFPLHDIDFIGKMYIQPMTFTKLYRGRIGWVQSVSYKQVDNSPEAFDQIGEEEAPLRTFICTPFAQCAYLYLNYGQKGMRVLEHLKGESPELVAYLEQIILPEVPTDLITLATYLAETSASNIENAGLDYETKKKALETLASMMSGTSEAIKYCRELIAESEAEILTRNNKGWGKSHLDQNDRFAYTMTRKVIPAESTLDNSPEKRTNELLEKFVNAVAGNRPAASVEVAESTDGARVVALEKELADLKAKFELLLETKVATGAPVVEDTTVVSKTDAEKALQQKLNQTKNNPRK